MEYFSVNIITRSQSNNGKSQNLYCCDLNKKELEESILQPYLSHQAFIFDGYNLEFNIVSRLKIIKTNDETKTILSRINENNASNGILYCVENDYLFDGIDKSHAADVTCEIINEVKKHITISNSKEKLDSSDNKKFVSLFMVMMGINLMKLKTL